MRLTLFAILGLAACGGGAVPQRSTATVVLPPTIPTGASTTVEVAMADEAGGHLVRIPAAADSVWAVLPDILAVHGVPVDHVDADARVLGTRRMVATRTLGGRRLSQLVDCGHNAFGEAVADGSRVELAVTSRVTATGDGSQVVTAIAAMARPAGSAGVRCVTRGVLERTINAALLLRFVR